MYLTTRLTIFETTTASEGVTRGAEGAAVSSRNSLGAQRGRKTA